MRLGSRLCACEACLCVCIAPINFLLANRTFCEYWHRRHTVLFERSMVGAGAVAPFDRGSVAQEKSRQVSIIEMKCSLSKQTSTIAG